MYESLQIIKQHWKYIGPSYSHGLLHTQFETFKKKLSQKTDAKTPVTN